MALHLKSSGLDFVDFGQSTQRDNELLDDYEEGLWTPSGTNVSASGLAGLYTKIGNFVHNQGWLSVTGTGPSNYGGLPFTTSTGTNALGAGVCSYNDNTTSKVVVLHVNNNNTTFYLKQGINTITLTTGQQIHFCCQNMTAS
jgi:hypothetical protein